MGKEIINLPNTPEHPYSPAVRAGDFIFVSGQIGAVDAAGSEVKGTADQTRQCLEKIKQILAAAGASLDDVVKVTVFLHSEADVAAMNEVYRSYFPEDKPARSTAITGLPQAELLVEIDCIAHT